MNSEEYLYVIQERDDKVRKLMRRCAELESQLVTMTDVAAANAASRRQCQETIARLQAELALVKSKAQL